MNFDIMMQVLYDLQHDVVSRTEVLEGPAGFRVAYFDHDGAELYALEVADEDEGTRVMANLAAMSARNKYNGEQLYRNEKGEPRYEFKGTPMRKGK